MNKFLASVATFFLILPQLSFGGGVDLDLLHGARYVYLGGNHVALKNDAYGVFYNPANMTTVTGPVASVDQMNLLFTYQAPVGGTGNDRHSILNWGPFFYMGGVYPMNDRVSFGLAVFPTAAQGGKFENVDYGGAGSGREYSNRLMRIEISPAVGVKLLPQLSVGAAWKIGYTQYDKKVGVFAGVNSAYLASSLHTWDFQGFKLGALFDNLDGLTAGVTFRLENPLTLEGNGDVTTALGTVGGKMKQDITLPAQLQAGIAYDFIPSRWMATLTYEYTMNESLRSDSPNFTSGTAMATVFGTPGALATPLNYRDSHSIHYGTEYTIHLSGDRRIAVGVGGVYDTMATPQSNPNPTLSPNAAYVGWSAGTKYMTDRHEIGLALNYGQTSTTVTAAEIDPLVAAKVFPGKYAMKVFYGGLDYTYRF